MLLLSLKFLHFVPLRPYLASQDRSPFALDESLHAKVTKHMVCYSISIDHFSVESKAIQAQLACFFPNEF